MKLPRFFRNLAAPVSLEVPNPAGDYAGRPDPMGYVAQPHVAMNLDEQTGLDLSLPAESWRRPGA